MEIEKQAILKLDALPTKLFTFLCYCALKNSRIFVLIESENAETFDLLSVTNDMLSE